MQGFWRRPALFKSAGQNDCWKPPGYLAWKTSVAYILNVKVLDKKRNWILWYRFWPSSPAHNSSSRSLLLIRLQIRITWFYSYQLPSSTSSYCWYRKSLYGKRVVWISLYARIRFYFEFIYIGFVFGRNKIQLSCRRFIHVFKPCQTYILAGTRGRSSSSSEQTRMHLSYEYNNHWFLLFVNMRQAFCLQPGYYSWTEGAKSSTICTTNRLHALHPVWFEWYHQLCRKFTDKPNGIGQKKR